MAAKEISKKRKAAPSNDEIAKKKKTTKATNGTPDTLKTSTAKQLTVDNEEDDFQAFSGSDEHDDHNDPTEADRIAKMLKGFESSSDEDDDEDAHQDRADDDETAIANSDLPLIPSSASSSLTKTQLPKSKSNPDPSDPPVILYIGHIPHGFYEPQMRAYFSQFGTVAHLRLSRNKRTGAPKHYAFLSFESGSVARIVAETMDNYLLFGHVLKVKIVEEERAKELVEKGLWKGEGRKWKLLPRAGMQRGMLKSAGREEWVGRVRKENRRRRVKGKKLEALGYVFEGPKVRSVDTVPRQNPKGAEGDETDKGEATNEGEKVEVKSITDAASGGGSVEHLLAGRQIVGDQKRGKTDENVAVSTRPQKSRERKIAARESKKAAELAAAP